MAARNVTRALALLLLIPVVAGEAAVQDSASPNPLPDVPEQTFGYLATVDELRQVGVGEELIDQQELTFEAMTPKELQSDANRRAAARTNR